MDSRLGLSVMLTRWLGFIGCANLLLLTEWRDVELVYRHDVAYFADGRFPLTYVWSVALAGIVLGTALAAVFTGLGQIRALLRPAASARLSIATTTVAVVVLWLSATPTLVLPTFRAATAVLIATCGIGFFLRPPSTGLSRLVAYLFALTALFVPVFFVTAIARYLTFPFQAPSVAQPIDPPALSTGRVVWVVFDELDSTLAISRRPSGLQLPAFDRLRTESFEATQAYSPGRWTLDAMPTLWTGRPVAEAIESGPRNLLLTFADSPGQHWFDPSASVFARAHAAGFRVGIAGWYHPYCRLFDAFADRCLAVADESASFSVRRARLSTEGGMRAAIPRLIARHGPWSVDAIFAGGFTTTRDASEQAYARAMRVSIYARVHERSLEMVRDATLSLVFVHYPIPHLPGLFDREHDAAVPSVSQSYEGNLVLMDHTLRDLRAALEDAGLWNATTLVVHSDHALRPALWKQLGMWSPALEDLTGGREGALTPFVVKMSGGPAERMEYSRPFSAALTADVVLGALHGRLHSSADLMTWLDVNRGRIALEWPIRTPGDR